MPAAPSCHQLERVGGCHTYDTSGPKNHLKSKGQLEASSQITERSKASKSEWEMTKKNRDKNPKSLIRANVNGKKNRGQNTFRANALKTGRKMQKIRCTKTKKTWAYTSSLRCSDWTFSPTFLVTGTVLRNVTLQTWPYFSVFEKNF